MADRYVEVTRRGYGSKMMGSLVGVVFGLLMLPGGLILLGWNEYRTVHRSRGIAEAESVMHEVATEWEPAADQEGALVHVTGKATTEDRLTDPEFAIEEVALHLAREVEMYQWVEHKESRTRNKVGGGTETVTTYEYHRQWHRDRVDSGHFHESSGHSNPQPRFASRQTTAANATLGAFRLSENLINDVDAWQNISPDLAAIQQLSPQDANQFLVDADWLYFGGQHPPQPSSPQLGDLRLRFRVVRPTEVSVLAKQSQSALGEYRTSNGEPIENLELGIKTSAEMIDTLRRENSFLAWALRGGGWLLTCIGIALILGPLSSLASVIPIIGRLTGMAVFFVSLLMSISLALFTIGVAWIAVRPVWAVALFAAAGVSLWLVLRRNKQPNPTTPPPLPMQST